MELLTLSLRSSIAYTGGSASSLLTEASNPCASEGTEYIFEYDYTDSIEDSPDGPRWKPQAAPARAGKKAGGENGGPFVLPAGEYLFMQDPAPFSGQASIACACEWFARESWWSGERGVGRILVRAVREDGKTALQVLRAR